MLLGPSRRPEGTRAVLSADGAYKLTRDRLIKPPPSSKFAPLAIRGTWRCVFPLVCISIRTDGARRIRAGNSADQCKLGDGGLISCSALVGWLADLPLLTNWEPDFVTMKPATALAILLIALDLLPQLSGAPRWRIAIGVIGTLIGASRFIQELGGLELGLESWLAPPGAVPGPTSCEPRLDIWRATGLPLSPQR
jgi:hypothetical protein